MDDIKSSEDKINFRKKHDESDEKIDSALFDSTLTQIEKVLKAHGEKIQPKQGLKPNESEAEETNNYSEEHTIDNAHLNMEVLHSFSPQPEANKKDFFGFYTYLALGVGIIFAIYELLNIFKDVIISNYPITEPYIEYFYEVIEILAYIVMNFVTFLKNLL